MPKILDIPRGKMQDGVNLCKKNIGVFLVTAENLVDSHNLNHAAIIVEFAIEEFGKILMLKDEFVKGSNPVQVPHNVLTNHIGKSERAWKTGDGDALDIRFKMISDGGFERSDNGKKGYSRGYSQVINISHFIRLECAFVDFDENVKEWFVGHPQLSKNRLQNLIEHIKKKVGKVVLQ